MQLPMQKIKNNQDSTKPPKMVSSTVMDYHKSELDWNLRQGIHMNNCKAIVKNVLWIQRAHKLLDELKDNKKQIVEQTMKVNTSMMKEFNKDMKILKIWNGNIREKSWINQIK